MPKMTVTHVFGNRLALPEGPMPPMDQCLGNRITDGLAPAILTTSDSVGISTARRAERCRNGPGRHCEDPEATKPKYAPVVISNGYHQRVSVSVVAPPRNHRYRHSRSESCGSFGFPSLSNGLCCDPS